MSESIIGKRVLIGAGWVDANDEVVERKQLFGTIQFVNDEAIGVKLVDGSTFELPPYVNALQPAEKGEYSLSGTSEVVRDPDYLAIWTFRKED